jgi:hypothetical protein
MTSKEKIKYRKSRTWSNIRQIIIERDKDTCQCCGAKLFKKNRQVHHKDESIYGNELEHLDLLVLCCSACHEMIERWTKKICKGKYASTFTLPMWEIIRNFTVEQIPEQKILMMKSLNIISKDIT